MAETTRAPVDVFERARTHERKEQLEAAKEADLLPYFRLIESQAGPVVEMEGRQTIMLGSNNYLGLTGDPRVKAASRDALEHYGTALTGSRFMNGTIPLHVELERGVNDGGGVLAVVDGVFSMEGDLCPVPDVLELTERYGVRLMVDEAHAVGVLGATGAGSCELYGVADRVDLRMGTFSKSLASCGGFIAGPADVVEFLKIASRPFMFTAAAVPAAVGAALEAVRICRAEGGPLFEKLLANASYLRRGFADLGLRVVDPGRLPDGSEATTPVVPVVVGEDWQAVLLWKALFDAGVYTNVALHPAVPPGGALLRTSLMATHERSHLDRALEIFAKVTAEFPELPRDG